MLLQAKDRQQCQQRLENGEAGLDSPSQPQKELICQPLDFDLLV